MSKANTPHFDDLMTQRGGRGPVGDSHPGFKAPGTAGPQARGSKVANVPAKGAPRGSMPAGKC